MGSRTQPAASDRVYEDFEPLYEWDRNERLVNIMLPGFRRDQLKVQVTSKPTLRLMGERLITDNRWRRFNLELPLLSDYDTDSVTAKFEGAQLSVKFGKLSLTKPKETTITPPSQQKPPAQEDKAEAAKTNAEVSEQKTPQKEETNKTETTDSTDKAAQEAKTNNGSSETKETPTPATAPKTRPISRSKTRLIDFSLGSGSNHVDDEVIEDLEVGKNKCKKLVKWMVVIYSVVALVGLGFYYGKNALTSYPEESYFQEL